MVRDLIELMEKRITYISSFTRELSNSEIKSIGEKSVSNNKRDGLTGALFTFNHVFYQILEGDVDQVDRCLARINQDDRHKEIFTLNIEHDIKERLYGEWSMKTVILDENTDALIRPVRSMLDAMSRNHRVLQKYAPKPVLDDLQSGGNPLEKPMRSVQKIVLFSDIVGSTTIAESLPMHEVTAILDVYYNTVILAVEKAGGQVAKLTGDGLMAYFDLDMAQNVIDAIIEALMILKKERSISNEKYLKYIDAGFGITAGRVLEGNIGSDLKKDYTLIGDVVNTAARMESATRKLNQRLLFDETVAKLLEDNDYKPVLLGKYQPKGKNDQLRIYTIDHPAIEGISNGAKIRAMISIDNKKSA